MGKQVHLLTKCNRFRLLKTNSYLHNANLLATSGRVNLLPDSVIMLLKIGSYYITGDERG